MDPKIMTLIKGLKSDNSTSYIRNGINAWLDQDADRRRYHIADALGVKRNYISMLCDDIHATQISIKLIPQLAAAVPTIDPLVLMLYRIQETWSDDAAHLLTGLVDLFAPDKHEQALLQTMEDWAARTPGQETLSSGDIQSHQDVLFDAYDKIMHDEVSAMSA